MHAFVPIYNVETDILHSFMLFFFYFELKFQLLAILELTQ